MPIIIAPHPLVIPADWEELDGSPVESRDFMRASAVMRLKGPWLQRYTIIDAYVSRMVGYPHQVYGIAGVSEDQALRAVGGSAKPFGAAIRSIDIPRGSINVYAYAIVEIRFGIPSIGVPVLTLVSDARGRGDVISETFETWSEFQELDNDLFEWSLPPAKDLSEKEAPSFQVNGLDYIFTRHGVETIPSIAYATNVVNDAVIYPLSPPLSGMRMEEETALYRGFRAHRTEDRNMATTKMSISYRFSIRRTGWNRFYRGDIGIYDQIVRKSDSQVHKNFLPVDFTGF